MPRLTVDLDDSTAEWLTDLADRHAVPKTQIIRASLWLLRSNEDICARVVERSGGGPDPRT